MQPTIEQVFSSMPSRFRTDKAENANARIHFSFTDGTQYTVEVHGGKCSVNMGLTGEPTCVVESKSDTYIQLETGILNPQRALMSGEVKVSDLGEMLRFSKWFRKFGGATETVNEHKERPKPVGPLAGYRILDFTKLLPGPLATLWLAQQGAEVIKVEDPSSPDPIRDYPPLKDGVSVYNSALNNGKKSLAIHFRTEEGKAILHQLVKDMDVVIEQFRPDVMKVFGLDYQTLKGLNPRIIMVSITGYGQTGPMAHFPGHDLNYLSYSGILDGLRDSNGTPVIPTSQLADVAGGSMMALNAVTLALLHRERTGEGQHVDVAMTNVLPYLHSLRWAEESATGHFAGQLSGKMACYNVYRCQDGKYVALGALEPKFWKRFCFLVAHPEWEGRILEANQSALIAEVAALFSSNKMQYWVDKLEKEDVCFSPVLTLSEAANHRQFQQIGFPVPLGSSPTWPATPLGQDNFTILQSLGISLEEIQRLKQNGVLE
jgi:alpha-methylacyl-CoA racemase